MHNVIFDKYPDFYTNVSMSSYSYYKKWIWKPIRDQRKIEISESNKTRFLFNQIDIDERFGRNTIPSRQMYREVLIQKSRVSKVRRGLMLKLKLLLMGTKVENLTQRMNEMERPPPKKYEDEEQLFPYLDMLAEI